MSFQSVLKILVSVALLWFSFSPAHAESLPPAVVASFTPSKTCTKQNVDLMSAAYVDREAGKFLGVNQLQSFGAAGKAVAGTLNGMAKGLAGAILLLTVLSGIMLAMSKGQSVSSSVVDNLIIGGIVLTLLVNYSMLADSAIDFASSLNNVMGGDPGAATIHFMQSFFFAIANMAKAAMAGFDCLVWYEKLAAVPDWLISVLLMLLAMYLAVLALVELIQVILMGPVLLAVGIGVGPLFIATLVSKFTKPWFDRWLGFVSGAAMLQFVALVMLNVLGAAITALSASTSGMGFTGQALGIAMLMLVLGKLFSGLPGIVSALVPANLGFVGGGGGSALSSGAKSIQAIPSRIGSTGAAAVTGAKAVHGAATLGGASAAGKAGAKALGQSLKGMV